MSPPLPENEAELWLDRTTRRYEPGEELTVRWRLAGWQKGGVVSVEASLLWYTAGEGEEDFAVHHFERHRLEQPPSQEGLHQDELHPLESSPLESDPLEAEPPASEPLKPVAEESEQSFTVTLPLSPCSYDGQIVKVCWAARLRGFFPKGKQRIVEESFWLACEGPETIASKAAPPDEVEV